MKYRKKPVVIEAIEWKGDNLREIIDFAGLHSSAEKWTWNEYKEVVATEGLKIFTLEGSHMASIGDMIIKGVQGEFYPCKPDIFAKTYEKVAQKEKSETASSTSTNTTKAEIKPCENDNCVNYSEDYDYNCCYFMDCKERV